jgi:hypothetical protein
MPDAVKERKSRAKIGFRTVERVGHNIGLFVLRGRRIKPEAHIEIGVLLRGNLKSKSVRFEGRAQRRLCVPPHKDRIQWIGGDRMLRRGWLSGMIMGPSVQDEKERMEERILIMGPV